MYYYNGRKGSHMLSRDLKAAFKAFKVQPTSDTADGNHQPRLHSRADFGRHTFAFAKRTSYDPMRRGPVL